MIHVSPITGHLCRGLWRNLSDNVESIRHGRRPRGLILQPARSQSIPRCCSVAPLRRDRCPLEILMHYYAVMAAPLRFGVLGAARIAPMALIRPARRIAEAQVAAI